MTCAEQRAAVLIEARRWLGTPWHHRGRVLGAGVDCAMLAAEVFHAAGLIERVQPEDYPAQWHLHRDDERLLAWVEAYCVEVTDPQPADLVLYRFGRAFSHVGIVTAWPEIIHAARRQRCVLIEDGDSGDYAPPRERRFFRARALMES